MDTESYDKRRIHPYPYGGYEPRKQPPTSIVVHSTSNPHQKNTAFDREADYLLDSKISGAHYLIGKDGRIVRFLDPRDWAAWHAGAARPEYTNQRSIGIELHHSVGDPPYPRAQLDALAALLRSLMAEFSIPVQMVETHGQIATPGPYNRKSDPSDWPHRDFLTFRSALVSATPPVSPPKHTYRVKGVPVYERSDRTGPLWGYLHTGDVVEIDDRSNGHLADGRGFVHLEGLSEVTQ